MDLTENRWACPACNGDHWAIIQIGAAVRALCDCGYERRFFLSERSMDYEHGFRAGIATARRCA